MRILLGNTMPPALWIASVISLTIFVVSTIVRRWQAARWNSDTASTGWRAQVEIDPAWLTFRPPTIWGKRDCAVGNLTVDAETQVVEFRGDDQEQYSLKGIGDVAIGRGGADPYNNWISFTYDAPNGGRVRAYVNDGGWYGWRPMFLGTNRRLFECLKSMSAP